MKKKTPEVQLRYLGVVIDRLQVRRQLLLFNCRQV